MKRSQTLVYETPSMILMQGLAGTTPKQISTTSFVDPFREDFEAFIRTFCGSANLFEQVQGSIPSTLCTSQNPASIIDGNIFIGKADTAKAKAVKGAHTHHHPVRDRPRLTLMDATWIFRMKKHKTAKTAALVATKYRITPKAVRDIWSGNTWTRKTKPLDRRPRLLESQASSTSNSAMPSPGTAGAL